VLINSPYIADLIQKSKLEEIKEVMANNNDIGMCTFDQALFQLCSVGKISAEEALAHADSRNDLSLRLRFAEESSKGF
ncbi:MAG TPA: type IV pili twitching motility protein PilT, partial [Methylophilaceae bacterium]|nr:type IV pili twitching motility protein PilT [Methylophilaceae bacterium]